MNQQEKKAYEDRCKELDQLKQVLKDIYYWAPDDANGLIMIRQIVKTNRHLL